MRYDTVSFISDLGTHDESVAVCKSVLRATAPHVVVIDITHEIPPFDIRSASMLLARASSHLAPGVVMAVVDPGSRSNRRMIGVELSDGDSVLVGPDNGLLAPATSVSGGPQRVVELNNEKYLNVGRAVRSASRDVYAVAAAHLCNGVELGELGELVDPETLVPGVLPFGEAKGNELHADVLWVDRFGNVLLNVTAEQLAQLGASVIVKTPAGTARMRKVEAFDELSSNELGYVEGDDGLVSLVANRSSAALLHRLAIADSVVVTSPLAGG